MNSNSWDESLSTDLPPPTDYRIILPQGWYRVALESEDREKSINALVNRQFKGIDNSPHLKEEFRRYISKRARKIYRNGGIEFFMSFQEAGPLAISASLVVSLIPSPHRPQAIEGLAQEISSKGSVGKKVDVHNLRSGKCVRSVELDSTQGDSQSEVLTNILAHYYVPIPGAESLLLLSFSSPLGDIGDAMVELYDAIAGSLSWVD